ncbi:MAG: SDR family NAD(P)-dependent oxidoreductase [Rhizobacter sp.]
MKQFVSRITGLTREHIDDERNLADLGLDSVNLADLARQVGTHLGVEITPAVFFSHPTLGQFTRHLLATHGSTLQAVYGGTEETPTEADDERQAEAATTVNDTPVSPQPVLAHDEPIAIIGMSGRFPGARSVDAFWRLLADGRDEVHEIPPERFDWKLHHGDPLKEAGKTNGRWLAALDGIDEFDPRFFEISPLEAQEMDPRQRLLLQEAWRALEDAGCGREQLDRERVGMFVGVEQGDYELVSRGGGLTGTHDGILAARLAYVLNLKGPAMALNTACSSGLVAAHLACQSLRAGDCDTAVVASVNLLLTPEMFVRMGQAGMLSPDGVCHAFDKKANGLVPGEAVVALVIKRLSQAEADGDPIHAVIRGSGINYDGKTNGITAPSGAAQARLIRDTYARHGIDAGRIGYVVAHGTGTRLGDPVEVNALTEAFKGARSLGEGQCAIGSTKPNVGHAFAASGLVSLVALVQALKHEAIPASLHCEEENDYIEWAGSPFYVSKRLTPWQGPGRLGAVSAFGMSGTNAHLVVQSHDALHRPARGSPWHLLVLSAKTAQALNERALQLVALLQGRAWTPVELHAMSHTLLNGRQHFSHRAAVVVRNGADALRAWQQLSGKDTSSHLFRGQVGREFVQQAAMKRYGQDLVARGERPPQVLEEDLLALADLYCQGYDLHWPALFGPEPPRRIGLPGYPFAKERHWAEPRAGEQLRAARETPVTALLHPLLHRNTSTLSQQRFSSVFTGEEFFLEDHQVQGRKLLPGVAQLEMARQAVALSMELDTTQARGLRLEGVVFARPIVVGAKPLDVRVVLQVKDEGAIGYEIHSREDGAHGEVVQHGQGRVVLGGASEARRFDLEALAALCRQSVTHRQIYDAYARRGIRYGKAFQGLQSVRAGRDANVALVVGELALPDSVRGSHGEYALHPSLLDAALQASIGLTGTDAGTSQTTLLPFAMERLEVWRDVPAQASVVLRRTGDSGSGAVEKIDVSIVDAAGQECVRMSGFSARALPGDAPSKPVAAGDTAALTPEEGELALVPVWDAFDLSADSSADLSQGASDVPHLIVASAAAPRSALEAAWPHARWLDQGDEDIATLAHRIGEHGPFEHLVWVAPAGRPALHDGEHLVRAQDEGVVRLFRLLKALIGLGHGARPLRLTVLTQQAVAIDAADDVVPDHAGVHGLVGSLAKEYPRWSVSLVDLPQDESVWPMEAMRKLPAQAHGDALAYRRGQWHRQRLLHCHLPVAAGSPYRDGGVYLILGGAGGLGVVFTEHLLRRHRAQIVWIGRRAEDAAITANRERLSALGPAPEYIAADAGDAQALQAACREIVQRHGAIHGVVHAAIVLKDQSLARMDEATLRTSLSAKVDTSVRMAQAFAGQALDFMLFFSSVQSSIKAPGQGNYAAGCTFIDAYAQALGRDGVPVKVINWGYWGSVGVVASEAYRNSLARSGIGSIEPASAMAQLDRLLASPVPQLTYLKITRPEAMDLLAVEGSAHVGVVPATGAAAQQVCIVRPLPAALRDGAQAQAFEALLASLLQGQLRELGLVGGSAADLARWSQHIGLPPLYRRWIEHSLRIVGETGTPVHALAPMPQLWEAWAQARQQVTHDPGLHAQATLADATLKALPQILRGEKAATAVIFPNASMALVEGVYRNNAFADHFNDVLVDQLCAHVAARLRDEPHALLHIAEMGAGTGGTSALAFERLAPHARHIGEYCYTDISTAFLLHGEERYRAIAPYLQTRLFDAGRPLAAQGFEPGRYDVVIATNVLHATPDIRQTLRNGKALLKRNGLLLLNEIMGSNVFTHLTFGLLEGWWLYRDEPLRVPGSPALAPQSWNAVLRAEGFHTLSWPAEAAQGLGQQVIAAFSDGVVRQDEAGMAPPAVRVAPVPARAPAPASPGPLGDTRGDLREAVQQVLVQTASQLLKLAPDQLDLDADLSEFGFDSINLTGYATRLNERLGLELSPTVFFEHPSLFKMGEYLVAQYKEQVQQALGAAVIEHENGTTADGLLDATQDMLVRLVSEMLKLAQADLDLDADLSEFGFDSISFTGFGTRLNERYGLDLSPTVFFEHPTLARLSLHLVAQYPEQLSAALVPTVPPEPPPPAHGARGRFAVSRPTTATAATSTPVKVAPGDVAIIGLSGRYPMAENLDAYWARLREGADCIGEVPANRFWDESRHFDAQTRQNGKSYCKWGGFIDGVEEFDPLLFNISPRDAEQMDPQERLFLQSAHEVLEGAGYTRARLAREHGGRVGVYAGVIGRDYSAQLMDGATCLGGSIANRVSHCFGLEGPSMVIDTMCSSSGLAIHLACKDLQQGECDLALAGGVNLTIGPGKFIVLSQRNLLGSHAGSRSFSRGDGYLPAEGVGAVLLKPLGRALADGDDVLAVIKGSATVHAGSTNAYMVPNPQAQVRVMMQALARAGVNPSQVGYVEAAANGSTMGDAIELASLGKVFSGVRTGSIALGSAKANLGHPEGVSGVAQLGKVVLQMRHQEIVPTPQAVQVNPDLRLESTPFELPSQLRAWGDGEAPRTALVNVFGGGGTYVSLVVQEYTGGAVVDEAVPEGGEPQLVVLSARTRERLQAVVQGLIVHLRHHGVSLQALARTLQSGREAMQARLAVVVGSQAELLAALQSFLDAAHEGHEPQAAVPLSIGDEDSAPMARERRRSHQQEAAQVAKLIAERDLAGLAQHWVRGSEIDWAQLHGNGRVRWLRLPTYPFSRQRCWLDADGSHAEQRTTLRGASVGEALRDCVAHALKIDVAELPLNRPLRELGMSSIQAIEIRHGMEQVSGREIALELVAFGEQSVTALTACIEALPVRAGVGAAEAHSSPQLTSHPAERHEPFPLSDIQESFLSGRLLGAAGGDPVGAHLYLELDVRGGLDIYRLNQAWQRLVDRHEMLRAVVGADGRQQIRQQVPAYRIKVVDMTRSADASRVQTLRHAMEHRVYQAGAWPLFDIRVALHGGGLATIHLSLDELIVDGQSLDILLREWSRLYQEPDLHLPALALSFRDHVLAQKAQEGSERSVRDLAYWMDKLGTLPRGPVLPVRPGPSQAGRYRRSRLSAELDPTRWNALKARAEGAQVSPTVLLLSVFAKVLQRHAAEPRFSLVLTYFNRPAVHPQIQQLVGPLISTSLFVAEPSDGMALRELAQQHQRQLWSGLDHASVSGVRVLRELKARRRLAGGFALPVVFTSTLNNLGPQEEGALGEIGYLVNQTPQVFVDHQVREHRGVLHTSWDVARDHYTAGLMDELFATYMRVLRALADDAAQWDLDGLLSADPGRLHVDSFQSVGVPAGLQLQPDPERRYEPFAQTDQQLAYAFGRSQHLPGGGQSCQVYQEIEARHLDGPRLHAAFITLLQRHPMLRTRIDADGRQQLMAELPALELAEHDLAAVTASEREQALRDIRAAMVDRVAPLGGWPYLEMRVSRLSAEQARIHLCVDLIVADANSIGLIVQELLQLYAAPQALPPAPEIGMRDYMQACERYRGSAGHRSSTAYWERKFVSLPGGPRLPRQTGLVADGGHRRVSGRVPGWAAIRAKAQALGVPESCVLLAAYLEVLHVWNERQPLSVVVPSWQRLPLHEQIGQVVGDFTAMCWVPHDGDPMGMAERALEVHRELSGDLAQRPVSGLSVLRRVALRDRTRQLSFPVVFTDHTAPVAWPPGELSMGESISKTPQVWLDCMSLEHTGGELHCAWDYAAEVYPPAQVEAMFAGYLRLLERLATDEHAWHDDQPTRGVWTDELALAMRIAPAARPHRDEENNEQVV